MLSAFIQTLLWVQCLAQDLDFTHTDAKGTRQRLCSGIETSSLTNQPLYLLQPPIQLEVGVAYFNKIKFNNYFYEAFSGRARLNLL